MFSVKLANIATLGKWYPEYIGNFLLEFFYYINMPVKNDQYI